MQQPNADAPVRRAHFSAFQFILHLLRCTATAPTPTALYAVVYVLIITAAVIENFEHDRPNIG